MSLFLLKLGSWWSSKAWPWTKANWRWFVFFPVMVFVWAAGKRSGNITVVSDDEESDAAKDFQDKVEKDTTNKVEQLDEARRARVEEVVETHKKTMASLSGDQKAQADELLKDPEELNSFLHSVGTRQRQ